MVRSVVLVVVYVAALSSLASAAQPLRNWKVGSWTVSEHENFCMGRSPSIRSGATTLSFGMAAEDEFIVLVGNPSWRMREKRVRQVFVTIDRDYLGGFPTAALDRDVVAVRLPAHLKEGLQDGARISLQFDRATLTFPLNHTRGGLEVLVKCARERAKRSAAIAANPKATAPRVARSSSGSGIFVSADGHVLTSEHVVRGCSTVRVTDRAGRLRQAEILASDPKNDLALLRTSFTPSDVAALGASVRQGEWVAAFGFPLAPLLSTTGTFSEGAVAATVGIGDNSGQLQITVPVQPGNSGGPLFDKFGNVVGIVNAQLDSERMAALGVVPQNVNFAIKASVARIFLESRQVEMVEGGRGEVLAPEDVADRAREVSVFIRCNGNDTVP